MMRHPKIIIPAILLSAVILLSFSIFTDDDGRYRAYRVLDLPFSYQVNDNTTDEFIEAINAGAIVWNDVKSSYFEFAYGGKTAIKTLGQDGVNLVYFDENYDNFTAGSSVIAFSSTFTSGYSTPNYKAVESDLIWNAGDFPPSLDGSPTGQDLQGVIAHEFGHHLGLGHTGDAGSPPGVGDLIPEATMYGYSSDGDTTGRSLHIDDIMGLTSIYPRWILKGTLVDSISKNAVTDGYYLLKDLPIGFLGTKKLEVVYQRPGYVKYDSLAANPLTGTFNLVAPQNEVTVTVGAFGYHSKDTTIYLGAEDDVNSESVLSFKLNAKPSHQVQFVLKDNISGAEVEAKILIKAKQAIFKNISFEDTTDNSGRVNFTLPGTSYEATINSELPYAFMQIDDLQISKDTTITIELAKADFLLVDDDYSPLMDEKMETETTYRKWLGTYYPESSYAYKELPVDSLVSTNLNDIPIIIWAAASNSNPGINQYTEVLKTYLDNGGKLLISGNDIFKTVQDTVFLRDYLHGELGGYSPTQLLRGVEGDPIGNYEFMGINRSSAEMIKIVGSKATPSFKFLGQESSGAIKFDSRYKVVFYSVGMELISGNYLDPDVVFNRSIEWLKLPTGISEQSEVVPQNFVLYQSYPNPFNSETIIKFYVNKKQQVSIDIYNSLGEKIRSLVNGTFEQGTQQVSWNGKNTFGNDVASGVYYYSLKSANYKSVKKSLLVR